MKPTVFKNIVKRIQFAARFSSKDSHNEEIEGYHEDFKLNSYHNASIRKRFNRSCSRQTSRLSGVKSEPFDAFANFHNKKIEPIKGEIQFLKEECKDKVNYFLQNLKKKF